MKLNNPFLVRGYAGGEYFCDRDKETAKLMRSLENEGDVTLIAPRRFGKTGLIHHVFGQMPKEWTCIYMDIFATQNLADFTKLFASAVVESLDTKAEKIMGQIAKFFKSCRPTVTPQESGMPKFSFDIVPEQAETALQETFEYIKHRDRRIVIAIDEFQQVLTYPEKGTEALLRSYMQFLPTVRFIFSGSRQHLMQQMFLSPQHPFYQSTDILSLRTIPKNTYADFAARFFESRRKPFDRNAFSALYDRFDGVTWYVQMILRQVWAENRGLEGQSSVDAALEEIIGSRNLEYHDLLHSQSESARAILKALAIDGPVAEPLSQTFISRHRLRAASTVASSLKNLVEADLVYRSDNGHFVYDRFFGIWLKSQN